MRDNLKYKCVFSCRERSEKGEQWEKKGGGGQERACPHFCTLLYRYTPLRPNIWGRVTDWPLFAPRHSNVLPAPAPMSINGRHVPKHIQHTKRTLWLEEMDCAQDWQGTLEMCQSLKGLCFYPCRKLREESCFRWVSFIFVRNLKCFTFGCRREHVSDKRTQKVRQRCRFFPHWGLVSNR